MRNLLITRFTRSALILLVSLGLLAPLHAQQGPEDTVHAGRNTSLVVPIYKSRIVELPAPAKRVSIGNPDIADVLILKSNELYILGKDLGTTNVLLWDAADHLVSSVSVSVTHDLEGLRAQLAAALPGDKIEALSAKRDIVLTGAVSSPLKVDAAMQIAQSYLEQAATAKEKIYFQQQQNGGGGGAGNEDRKSGKVINLMSVTGAQQVMLQVRVAEVHRDILKSLDAQFYSLINKGRYVAGSVNGGATFPNAVFEPNNVNIPVFGNGTHQGGNPIGPVYQQFQPTTPSITNQGLFASFLSNSYLANLVIDAAQQRGLAKVLAEPTLTTLTGQEAQFLSGGSFPIPVPQQYGQVTVEFKEFGVKLLFQPLVLDSGRINLKLNISVSQLVSTNSLVLTPITSSSSFAVPAISERRAVSTVELADGQTIGIAGLINENMTNAITKFPGLGDLPILGALFRSQSFQKGETELVILVTPTLAKPLEPGDIRMPTDKVVDPSNVDFYLFGRGEGTPPEKKAPVAAPPANPVAAPVANPSATSAQPVTPSNP